MALSYPDRSALRGMIMEKCAVARGVAAPEKPTAMGMTIPTFGPNRLKAEGLDLPGGI